MDGSPEQRSDASSGFSGALYDAPGRLGAYPSGVPQTPSPVWASPSPPPAQLSTPQPGPPASGLPAYVAAAPVADSPWWSDGATDPWRNPNAAAAVVIAAPGEATAVEPPDFTPRRRSASLGQVLLISVLAALLAGVLGGALGYTAAVKSGVSGSSALGGGSASAPALAQRAPTSVAGIVKAIMPSVVTVRVPGPFDTAAIGSGFIVSGDGYIITNDHVIDGLNGAATVTFSDSTTAPATLVGSDPESDIAVLKLSKTGLPAVTFGDSDSVAVGDPVLAVGAPLDLPNTVTAGIISALHRPLEISSGDSPTRYYSAIQTDAAVNHGNSGGPLIDAAGHVIGVDAVIKSLGASDEDTGNIGLAFAIPINQARRVAEQIISTGKVSHTVMGATVQTSYQQSADGGVPLSSVAAGGPADVAGIKAGDLIMDIGGSLLTASGDLTALVRAYAPGTIVPVVYQRGGSLHTVSVKLAADSG